MERCTSVAERSKGRGREGERMTGMQKRLLPSPVALMWAEDKVRLEIGRPGAQWGKKERARGWEDKNRRKEWEEGEEK